MILFLNAGEYGLWYEGSEEDTGILSSLFYRNQTSANDLSTFCRYVLKKFMKMPHPPSPNLSCQEGKKINYQIVSIK